MRPSYRHLYAIVLLLPLALQPLTAMAEPSEPTEVVITGLSDRPALLDAESRSGSRLGLTVRETPAIIDMVTDAQLQERGARSSVEALNSMPGVTAANLASSPGVASMRGFSSGSVSLLYDGVRQTTSALITRNLDSWSFERIEVLKGPASVLYGEGALGGTINLVPKHPLLDRAFLNGLVSHGSFDSSRIAADANVPLGDASAARWVASYSRNGGYLDENRFESAATTASWTWRPVDALTVDLAADYYADDYDRSYWGTPLVPKNVARRPDDAVSSATGLVLDRALRDGNFNVADGLTDSRAWWLRSRVAFELNDAWSVANELNYYDADRRWLNSENYTFNAASGLLDRGTTRIEHDHQFWSERVLLSGDLKAGGRRNRVALGAEVNRNEFFNPRRFGTTASVDAYGRQRGAFPTEDTPEHFPGSGNRVDNDSELTSTSVFLENAFNLTDRWLLVGGLRYERIQLDRVAADLNAGTSVAFDRDFDPVSWRFGAVYDLTPKVQTFAQYSSAVAPVGSLLLISQTNARFALTKGRSVEAGIKASVLNESMDVTFAAFDIGQDDIITRDPLNSSIAIQGGSQTSRGVELSLSAAVTRTVRLDASVSAIDAKFDELIEAGGANRAGNTPPNVPETIANVFGVWNARTLPLSVSMGARYASHFFTNNANTVRVTGYTAVDGAVSWRLPVGEITLRGRNLLDELYADWTGSSATQVLIAAPRSFEVSYFARFEP